MSIKDTEGCVLWCVGRASGSRLGLQCGCLKTAEVEVRLQTMAFGFVISFLSFFCQRQRHAECLKPRFSLLSLSTCLRKAGMFLTCYMIFQYLHQSGFANAALATQQHNLTLPILGQPEVSVPLGRWLITIDAVRKGSRRDAVIRCRAYHDLPGSSMVCPHCQPRAPPGCRATGWSTRHPAAPLLRHRHKETRLTAFHTYQERVVVFGPSESHFDILHRGYRVMVDLDQDVTRAQPGCIGRTVRLYQTTGRPAQWPDTDGQPQGAGAPTEGPICRLWPGSTLPPR